MISGREQLADWLERRDFSQREAARFLGMHWTTFHKILSGRRSVGLAVAVKLERLTGITIESWLPTSGGESGQKAEPAADKVQ